MFVRRMEFVIDNELGEIRRLSEALDNFARFALIPPKVLFKLNLAIDELITNTISYGYANPGRQQIDVSIARADNSIEVELRDGAIPFDPCELSTPDVELSVEERSIGGLGVHLVKTLIDEVRYRHDGAYNIVTLSMRLPSIAEIECA